MKAAAIQMDCILGDTDANVLKAVGLIREAAREGATLIALPELFSTGYRLDERYLDFAELIPDGKTVKAIESVAIEDKIFVVGCIVEKSKETGFVYDTAFIVGPNGYVGKTRKAFLWHQEKLFFCRGSLKREVFRTSIGNIGITICYEAGFPEIARYCAIKGAQVIVEVSALGIPRYKIWENLTRSRAMENGLFLVVADRVGSEMGVEFCGLSRIISPSGEVLAQASDRNSEAIVLADISYEEIARQRYRVPFLRDHLTSQDHPEQPI
jgi:predicted amidohydrolase